MFLLKKWAHNRDAIPIRQFAYLILLFVSSANKFVLRTINEVAKLQYIHNWDRNKIVNAYTVLEEKANTLKKTMETEKP